MLTGKEQVGGAKETLQLYALYGQSNMQGAGLIEEFDREPNPRILKLTHEGECEVAREPLHDWSSAEERLVVGPGYYFAEIMLSLQDDDVSIGLIPHARGGTCLAQWEQTTSKTYPRILERCANAQQKGTLKGVLWHQGEADCSTLERASSYARRFVAFFKQFRQDAGIPDLPVVVGQLGDFLRERDDTPFVDVVNSQLASIPVLLPHSACIPATGTTHIGDFLHFDTRSQRDVMAPRYATAMTMLCSKGAL